ncbi:hypothetical protein A9Q99_27380 [Gammaproteobacteria bacterium 45_16_T64]|nr:hypothetical protein A9Q99_27380 [Gammaproteobacteria bacterium 45_16_T64]
MSSVTDSILRRVSSPKLCSPGPARSEVLKIVECATRAPDHGRLKPWKFVVVQGEGLEALGALFEKSLLSSTPEASEAKKTKTRSMPLRAPLIIVAIAKVTAEHKVPVIEQVAATAAAIQNMQLAAIDLGYGAMWRTGGMAYSEVVRAHFDLEAEDQIVGYLYLGTPVGEPKEIKPQEMSECVEFWDK